MVGQNCHKILSENEICQIFSEKHDKMNYSKIQKVWGAPNLCEFQLLLGGGSLDNFERP